MQDERIFTAWLEGRAPQPPKGTRVRNGLILLLSLAAALILAIVLPVLFSAFDQFHPSTVRRISAGDSRADVIEVLGTADHVTGNMFEYYGVHFWRIPGSGDPFSMYGSRPNVLDLYDYLTRRWHEPYIGVEFDSFDHVIGVLLDADRPKEGVKKQKELKECHLLVDRVAPFTETDLWYAAEYTDGSYFMGPAVPSYRCDEYGTTQEVRWNDRFGNVCHAMLRIETESGNYAEGEDWYVSPAQELHILSDAGAEDFYYSRFDRSAIRAVSFDYDAVTVPDSVCSDMYLLETVSLPDTVESIGDNAFSGCMSLESIDLPATLESIGARAFSNCSALRTVRLPQGLRTIGSQAFAYCSMLEEIRIPDSVQSVGSYAFDQCDALRSVRLPDGLVEVEAYLFHWCRQLEQIELPDSVTSIGEYAFSASGLRQIDLPQGLIVIGGSAFINTSLEQVELPSSVTSIGDFAFGFCGFLRSVRLPQGLRSVGDGAFEGCESLPAIELPASLQELGARAFANCDALRAVSLPGGIGTVGDFAFYDCSSLESVTFGEGITAVGQNAFAVCGQLRQVSLPSTLARIESGAFANCGDSRGFSVTVPASVTYIGARAFWQSWVSEVRFEQPEGWVTVDVFGQSTSVPAADLSDAQATARLLYADLAEQTWRRG